jgi:tetraacyldisaccharide 4'-kinase
MLPLIDHHDFSSLPWEAGEADVILTEKDAVKIDPSRCGETRVWVVALDFKPEQAFEQALHERLKRFTNLLP